MAPFRWGIAGCGKISSDFATALENIPEAATVVACAARSTESAKSFANAHGIARSYGSYSELIDDPEVECVYVGTINTTHVDVVMECLTKKKPVLCEKPLGMTLKETQRMVDLARENKVFLMEAMWTRFIPVYRKARELIRSGKIGEVHSVMADFGAKISEDISRVYDKNLGGSIFLDLGVYVVAFATMIFGAKPDTIAAAGETNATGADIYGGATLIYKGRGIASLQCTGKARTHSSWVVSGSKGYIKFSDPPHASEHMEVFCEGSSEPEIVNLPVPEENGRHFNFRNSSGLQFEAEAVQKCVREGELECPNYTLDETLIVAEVLEEARSQTCRR